MRRVLEVILAQDGRIIGDPAPAIGVLELGPRSVNLAVQERIKTQFEAEGIRIPFPPHEGQVR